MLVVRAWTSGARFFASASWAPRLYWEVSAELSAAFDFHRRRELSAAQILSLKILYCSKIWQISLIFCKENILTPLKLTKTAKFRSRELILSLNKLFFLKCWTFPASAKWAQGKFYECELIAALLLESERWVERRSRFSSTSASWAALFFDERTHVLFAN